MSPLWSAWVGHGWRYSRRPGNVLRKQRHGAASLLTFLPLFCLTRKPAFLPPHLPRWSRKTSLGSSDMHFCGFRGVSAPPEWGPAPMRPPAARVPALGLRWARPPGVVWLQCGACPAWQRTRGPGVSVGPGKLLPDTLSLGQSSVS